MNPERRVFRVFEVPADNAAPPSVDMFGRPLKSVRPPPKGDGFYGDTPAPSSLREKVLAIANDTSLDDAAIRDALKNLLSDDAGGAAAETLVQRFSRVQPKAPTSAAARKFAAHGSLI